MRVSAKMTTTGRIDKARFENYLAVLHNIARKQEELDIIDSKLGNPPGMKISDMPRSTSPNHDKIAFLVQEKMEIEHDLKALEKYRTAEREELLEAVKSLENPKNSTKLTRDKKILVTEASVLRLRYFCKFSWNEINEALYSSEPEFDIKRDYYATQMFKLHGKAFIDFKKLTGGH